MAVRDDIMDEVQDAISLIFSTDNYPIRLASEPTPYRHDYLTILKEDCPIIMLADQGDDSVLVKSSTQTMYSIDVALFAFTRRDTWTLTKTELNQLIAAVEKVIDSPPDLGSAILELQYVEGLGHYFNDDNQYGYTTMLIRVLYYVTNGTY